MYNIILLLNTYDYKFYYFIKNWKQLEKFQSLNIFNVAENFNEKKILFNLTALSIGITTLYYLRPIFYTTIVVELPRLAHV